MNTLTVHWKVEAVFTFSRVVLQFIDRRYDIWEHLRARHQRVVLLTNTQWIYPFISENGRIVGRCLWKFPRQLCRELRTRPRVLLHLTGLYVGRHVETYRCKIWTNYWYRHDNVYRARYNIYGELSQCSNRYARANNKYMSYDPFKSSSYLIYYDKQSVWLDVSIIALRRFSMSR